MKPEEKTLQDVEGVEEDNDAEVDTDEVDADEEADADTDEVDTDEVDDDEVNDSPTQEDYNNAVRDGKNYKKGMMAAKKKLKDLQKAPGKPSKDSDFVTKADLQKDKESKAIKEVLIDNPEMDGDWSSFVGFIPKVLPGDDLDTIKMKINAGYAGYKSTVKEGDDSGDEDKKVKSDLSKTKGNKKRWDGNLVLITIDFLNYKLITKTNYVFTKTI